MVADVKEKLKISARGSDVKFLSKFFKNATRHIIRTSGFRRVKVEQLITNLVKMNSG